MPLATPHPRGSATDTLDPDKPPGALSLAGSSLNTLTTTFDFHYDFSTMGRGDEISARTYHIRDRELTALLASRTDTRHAEIYLGQA